MGKKIKSKARLDKYYYLAKEHGYRSRAAFKLIQLNKKFQFLESATCLIDLCAAPGGWLQVAAKFMPVSSFKIGVDLDPIKPVPGAVTFQADITSEKCRFLIRKEIKHLKADVVLNDGAPNVGGQWNKDAYNQSELVLFAVKLATEFLKEGGWFITKIFRSSDYNSLMYVLKQLFNKVEATKPQASRNESAEIFVVCQGYKAPSSIDSKLLDPKYALKQLEDEDEMKMNAVKSIKAMFDQKKNRSGYSNKLYNEKSFKDFVESRNPYQFLMENNKIKIQTDDCLKYLGATKCPVDHNLYFDDLQILGKKEVQELIIWRNKIRSKLMKEEKNEDGDKRKTKEAKEVNDTDVIEEIDEEMKMLAKQKKKKLEQEKKKKEKNLLRNKLSFIKGQDTIDNNDIEYDQSVFDMIRNNDIDIEELTDENEEEEDDESQPAEDENQFDLSEMSEDDYIEMMNEDIEENMRLFDETKRPGKEKKKRRKNDFINAEGEVEEKPTEVDGIVFQKKEDDEDLDQDHEDDGLNNEEEIEEVDDMQGEIELNEDLDIEDDDSIPQVEDQIIDNPLRKQKNKSAPNNEDAKNKKTNQEKEEEDEENNLSSDTDDEDLLGKKTKRKNKKNKDDLYDSDKQSVSSYDSDAKAEIRAIAKKMLRKKGRLEILHKSYNRYVFNDVDKAPNWFADEEKLHNRPAKPVTKNEIMAEKEALRKVNDRMPKKVLQAKARKKMKLAKRLDRVKKKAEAISNQDEINEFSKVKQIEKLYKKELSKNKEKKKYIVSRSFKVKHGKSGRNVRFVDKRLKKDKRAQKAMNKRKNKGK